MKNNPEKDQIPVDHKAWHPCLQGYVLAFPLGIAGDLVGRNPGRGTPARAEDLLEAPAESADCTDCLLHMADLSFSPSDPWDQAAGQDKKITTT